MADARAALFDLDGTLVDSRHDIAAAGNAARAAMELPPLPVESIQAYVGDGATRLIERLTPDAGPGERDRAIVAFHAHYAAHCCDLTAAFPGALAGLRRLRGAGWRIGVCTNKPQAYSDRIIAHCGLREVVDLLIGGDRTRKPDPGQLRELIVGLGSAPSRTWMVGDHHTDLRAAAAAGCRAIFCTWGFGHRADAPADVEAGSLAEAVELLLRVAP